MNKTQLREKMESLAEELVSDVKSSEDLKDLNSMLFKLTLKKALSAEMDTHLGCPQARIRQPQWR